MKEMNEYEKELNEVCKYLSKPIKLTALQELVERATPKKVKEFGYLWGTKKTGNCPICGKVAYENTNHYKQGLNFCANCGQALDWSEL